MARTVAALYVQSGGAYFALPDVDPWDLERDARRYDGPHPVVAHPPCARWCRLASFVQSRSGHRVGDDGGTFAAALEAVRRFGGVLEHPAWSKAWGAYNLAAPNPLGGWQLGLDGSAVCHVEQGHYGHRAAKPTWLYVFGVGKLPTLAWGGAKGATARCSWAGQRRRGKVKCLSGVAILSARERSATPARFRDVLLGLARSARVAELERLLEETRT